MKTLENSQEPLRIALPERLVIETAAESASLLLAALAGETGVVLDASQLAQVDLAGLQVLCAAHRLGQQRRLDVRLERPAEALVRAAAGAGYTGRKCLEAPCLFDLPKDGRDPALNAASAGAAHLPNTSGGIEK